MLTRSRAPRSFADPVPVRVGNLGLGGPLDPAVNLIDADGPRRHAVISAVLDALRSGSHRVELLVDGKRVDDVPLVPELALDQLVLDRERLLALAAGPDGALASVERWMLATSTCDRTRARIERLDDELEELADRDADALALASEAFDVLARLELARGGRGRLLEAIGELPTRASVGSGQTRIDALIRRRNELAADRRDRRTEAVIARIRRKLVADALAAWRRVAIENPGPDSYAVAIADAMAAADERRNRLARLHRPTVREVQLAAELVAACADRVADFDAPARATNLESLRSGVRRSASERADAEADLASARRTHADLVALQADAASLVALEAEIADLQHLADRLLRTASAPRTVELLRAHPAVGDAVAEQLSHALWAAGAELVGDDLPTIAEAWLSASSRTAATGTELLDAAIAAADNEIAAAVDDGTAATFESASDRLAVVRRQTYERVLETFDDPDTPLDDIEPSEDKWSACEALAAQATAVVGIVTDRRAALVNARRQAVASDASALDSIAEALIDLLESAPHLVSRSGGVDAAALDRHIRHIKASTPATLADWLRLRTERHGISLPIIFDGALDDLPRADALAVVQDLAAASPMTQFIVLVGTDADA